MCDISASNASVLPVRLLLTVGESNTCEKAVANARSQFCALALVLFVHRNVFLFYFMFYLQPRDSRAEDHTISFRRFYSSGSGV